jgi:hypothetical protein
MVTLFSVNLSVQLVAMKNYPYCTDLLKSSFIAFGFNAISYTLVVSYEIYEVFSFFAGTHDEAEMVFFSNSGKLMKPVVKEGDLTGTAVTCQF